MTYLAIGLGWLAGILIIAAFIHSASKARTDRMLGEQLDAVTGRKG